jgi:glycosyltransferase involved in cell wall biosynthesis
MKLRASIVIPARDEADRLERVLRACRTAARRVPTETEIIVADHGSKDTTPAIARFLGARVVDATPARTIAGVRNRGAAVATGDVLAFLDADCVPSEEWLAAGLAIFDEQGRAGAAGLAPAIAPGEPWLSRASALFAAPRPPAGREEARWLPSANLLVRRAAFEAVGGFDEDLVTCEDYDLTVRLRARGFTLLRDPGLATVHLREPSSARALFRKERWRGLSSFEGAWRHGLVAGELPSLVLPPWHAAAGAALALAAVAGDLELALAALAALALPSLALAARAAFKARRPGAFPGLVAFAFIYSAARTAALVPPGKVRSA